MHRGERFPCPECDYKSTQRGSLQTHIKSIHRSEKTFQCAHCTYKATQKGNLKTQIKSIHEGERFSCPVCDYKARKDTLQAHIKSIHRGIRGTILPCQQCNFKQHVKANFRWTLGQFT